MLSAHPELAVPLEMRYLIDAYESRDQWPDLRDEAARTKLVDWILDRPESRYGRTGVPKKRARVALMEQTTLGSVLGRTLELYAEKNGKVRWGDKRPNYILHLPEILQMFPDAQIIDVVRDPRGAVSSMKELGWFAGSVGPGAELWVASIEAGRFAQARLAPDQYLQVRYEDLLDDPPTVLAGVAAFLGLDPDGVGDMVEYQGHRPEQDAMKDRYHANVAKGVDPTIAQSWRRRLDDVEIAFIESVTAGPMADHRYDPVSATIKEPRKISRPLNRRFTQRGERRAAAGSLADRWDISPSATITATLTTGQRDVTAHGSL
jgi:hypothetical protein